MKKNWIWFGLVLIFCVCAVIAGNILRERSNTRVVDKIPELHNDDSIDSSPVKRRSLSKALGVSEADMVVVGGVKRPKRDIVQTSLDLVKERSEYLAALPKVGQAPFVPHDTNATTKQLAKDLADPKKAAAATSVFAAGESFDSEEYLKDPQSYLEQTRPARVFQSLAAGEGVAPIERNSPGYRRIIQGESVFLEAKAKPGMPVTFHTQQLGEFDNRLKTISVAASDDGIAKVKYTAVSGVIGSVRIMAASPVHSGSLIYLVEVSVPE